MSQSTTITRDMVLELGCGTEIADEAVRIGELPVFVRDNGEMGDRRVSLWTLGGAEVIDTNGGARWQPDRGTVEEMLGDE